MNRGGLGIDALTRIEDKTGKDLPEEFQRVKATEPLSYNIKAVNMFDESYIAHLIEPQATTEDTIFPIEFINHEDEGKCTKSRSNLAAYCKHLTNDP